MKIRKTNHVKWRSFMIRRIASIFAIVLTASLIFSNYNIGNAATYSDSTQQGTGTYQNADDKYITKIKVDPYRGKKDLWSYIVKVCPDHNMKVIEVVLKSDSSVQRLGVNKVLLNGQCSYYGAVMPAKDGKTLGAEVIDAGEAIDRIGDLKSNLSKMSKQEFRAAWDEIMHYKYIMGW
jgi:hypothetical protein